MKPNEKGAAGAVEEPKVKGVALVLDPNEKVEDGVDDELEVDELKKLRAGAVDVGTLPNSNLGGSVFVVSVLIGVTVLVLEVSKAFPNENLAATGSLDGVSFPVEVVIGVSDFRLFRFSSNPLRCFS